MADEPRRSGRATKGQHKNASSSPAPQPASQPKPAGNKAGKKGVAKPEEEAEDDGGEVVRCICGQDHPKRIFVACDTCEVWQHNICMGMPEDDDELPEHYYCEQCQPGDHEETVQALAKGEKIWETRYKIAQNEKKAGKNRRGGNKGPPGWLKKPVARAADGTAETDTAPKEPQETGSKRKRSEVKEEMQTDEKPIAPTRQDKRRKSSVLNAETAIVPIADLPAERQKTANALVKIIGEEVNARVKAGAHKLGQGESVKSISENLASLIEYELTMNHGEAKSSAYTTQFRNLHANLKRNKTLVERLLGETLTAAELATMSSQDMASDELQKQRAQMKEQLDRQAVAIELTEGPKYRRTHKGDELIEDENQQQSAMAAPPTQPVRERTSIVEGEDGAAGSPPNADARSPTNPPAKIDTARASDAGLPRRQSSQQFDMSSIWAKTAQSPTATTQHPRPMQMPPRRRSSIKPTPEDGSGGNGTKEDADIDRMLQDDDYELPQGVSLPPHQIIWRGKLVQTADSTEPRVSARFVAGRDISSQISSWPDMLGSSLSIDGRLSIAKAEEYLLSLEWSSTVDISVLALSPQEGADEAGFNTVFEYFQSRERYAVVNKDKPAAVRDLYIIPVEVGAELPKHVMAMEYSSFKGPVQERVLIATFVVNRAPEEERVQAEPQQALQGQPFAQPPVGGANGNGAGANDVHHLPPHLRAGAPGPAGSPINTGPATFSPTQYPPHQQQQQHGPPPAAASNYNSNSGNLPPNPYQHPGPPPPGPYQQAGGAPPHPNPLVNEILGHWQHAPSAQAILQAQPDASRDQLVHLRRILEEDPRAGTDLEVLGRRLGAE